MSFTAIGDCVNVASRLEELAKGGEIIIGKNTFLKTQGHFRMQEKRQIFVKNKAEPVVCYKVLR